jgi:GNAT superfamily N-acetyltransferase
MSRVKKGPLAPAEAAEAACEAFWETHREVAPDIEVDVGAHGNTLELHSIYLDPAYRGQGQGSRTLDLLVRLADEYGVRVELEVGGDDDEDGIDLMEFYGSRGFVWQEGGYMLREPQENYDHG